MPTFSVTQSLSTKPPEVFAFLADTRNMARWNSGVAEVADEASPASMGTRCRYRFPGRRRFHHLECDAYREPSLIGYRGERMWTPLGVQSVGYLFDIRPGRQGSTLRMTVDVHLYGGMLLLLPIVALGWRRDLPEDLDRLRELLEPPAVESEHEDEREPAAEPKPQPKPESAREPERALEQEQQRPLDPVPEREPLTR